MRGGTAEESGTDGDQRQHPLHATPTPSGCGASTTSSSVRPALSPALGGGGGGGGGMVSLNSSHGVAVSTNPDSSLSNAASQASLAPSDVTSTTSEDLNSSSPPPSLRASLASSSVSLASSTSPSRPTSSASPDPPVHPLTDITDAVEEEHHGSMTALSEDVGHNVADFLSPLPQSGDVDESDDNPQRRILRPNITDSVADDTNGSSLMRVDQSMDGTASDIEEEYFEEYHLPNTHENAFVRHRSFRRKVELTPIYAPDAERIEGLVRTGELERHGSVRRKIVPNIGAGLYSLDEDISSENVSKPSMREFSEDFREIEKMMDDSNSANDMEEVDQRENSSNAAEKVDLSSKDAGAVQPKMLLMRGKNAFTSTPNTSAYASTADYASIDLSVSLNDHSIINNSSSRRDGTDDNNELESLSIEQSTMNKIRDCLDFSKCKDIYNLTGKLQDMLTPVEVEEVLSNSHRYVDVIDTGVLEALFNSISEQMSMTGQPMSISFNKHDPMIVKKREEMTPEQIELQKKIKQKLLMEELAMDSLPYIPQEEPSEPAVVMRRKSKSNGDEGEDSSSRFGTIERRKSIRLNANTHQEVEGVFIESDFQNSKLKRITAPIIDLHASGSQDDLDTNQSNFLEDDDGDLPEPRVAEAYNMDESSNSYASIPIIRISRTRSARDDDSVNNLYVEDAHSGDENLARSSGDETAKHFGDEDERRRRYSSNADDFDSDSAAISSTYRDASNGKDDVYSTPMASPEQVQEALPDMDSREAALCSLPPPQMLPHDLALDESTDEERHWRSVVIGGVWRRIDMKVIEPYTKCVHSGGDHLGHPVVVVSACQLPERSRSDYSYVMDNLFLYLLSRLEQSVAEDYILVYLSGGRNVVNTGPGFHWLKTAYQMIDRKLRKNLQALLVVHPTLWVRTIVALTRPFISGKFYRKLTFVYSLTELAQLLPLDQMDIPASVQEADFELMIREKKKTAGRRRPVPQR